MTSVVLSHWLDHSTIWSYPSSSSPVLQADTVACCSSSQKQVEVLLFSWPVRHCLDFAIYRPLPPFHAGWLDLGGCSSLCYSSWHTEQGKRGEEAALQSARDQIKATPDLNPSPQCVWRCNWRWLRLCGRHSPPSASGYGVFSQPLNMIVPEAEWCGVTGSQLV